MAGDGGSEFKHLVRSSGLSIKKKEALGKAVKNCQKIFLREKSCRLTPFLSGPSPYKPKGGGGGALKRN